MIEFHDKWERKARKHHDCTWCGCLIAKGSRYQVEQYKFDGEFTINKTCEECKGLWRIMHDVYDYESFENTSFDDLLHCALTDFGYEDGRYERLYLEIAKFYAREVRAMSQQIRWANIRFRDAGLARLETCSEITIGHDNAAKEVLNDK